MEKTRLHGQPGQGFLGLVQSVLEIEAYPLQFVVGEGRAPQVRELGQQALPEGLHVAGVEGRADQKESGPLQGERRAGNVVHELLVVFEGAVEPARLVAGEQLGQDFEAGLVRGAKARGGKGDLQPDLVPGTVFDLDLRLGQGTLGQRIGREKAA